MSDSPEAQARRYVELSDKIAHLEAEVRALKDEKSIIETRLLDHWASHGISQQRIGGRTLYHHSMTYYSAPKEAVEAAGLEDLLSVSTNSFSAYVREKRKNGEPLPAGLEEALRTSERVTLRVVKG